MSERNSGEVLLAFILGAIVGAAAGILYAPRSGKETRRKLQEFGEDVYGKLDEFGEEVAAKTGHAISEAKEKISAQKERVESAIDAGRRAFDKK